MNAATILAIILSLPLGAGARIRGIPVLRSSLLGYDVAGLVLDAADASRQLADLLGRVRASLRGAVALLRARGVVGGRLHVHGYMVGWTPQVDVAVIGLAGATEDAARRVVRECLVTDGYYVSGRQDGTLVVTGGYL